jgi:methylated-DNA-protein-cysteine methyltransferase related protein
MAAIDIPFPTRDTAAMRHTRHRSFSALPQRHAFFEHVWEIVRKVPRGNVTTYGLVAAVIRRPQGVTQRHFMAARARWVGQAMAHCPANVPWHRVVNAQGKVSLRERGDGVHVQRALLEAEGVVFSRTDQIDLHLYGWVPHTSRKH